MIRWRRWYCYWVILLLLLGRAGWSEETQLIGSGSETGVYYQAARAICQVIRNHSEDLRCRGRPTPGSVFNLEAVTRGVLDFGIVQSDRHWEASHGEGNWQDKPLTSLRSVFSLHPEAIMLVARRDSGIQRVEDIRGKRVNIGNPGSGSRINAEDLLSLHGLSPGEHFTALELQQDRASRALVDAKLEAFFYTVGNPSEAIASPARQTPIRIVEMNSPLIRQLLARQPYLVPITLPGGLYPGVNQPVATIGVKATVVTDASQDPQQVYTLVRLVFEHLDEIRAFHPALADLKVRDMLAGLSAPFHPGAARYYREQGLLAAPLRP